MATPHKVGLSAGIRRYRIQLNHGNVSDEITRAIVNSVANSATYKGTLCGVGHTCIPLSGGRSTYGNDYLQVHTVHGPRVVKLQNSIYRFPV